MYEIRLFSTFFVLPLLDASFPSGVVGSAWSLSAENLEDTEQNAAAIVKCHQCQYFV